MPDLLLDARAVRKPDKHPQIFEQFSALAVGESFVLINNHDPKHLREEFATDHPGEFSWQYLQRGPERWEIRITRLASTPLPRILCDTHETVTAQLAPDASGAIWKLQMSRRQLDANIIRLEPGSRIEAHAGADLDVLLHIVHGDGQLLTEVSTLALRPGGLLWLPRLSRREIRAGEQGLTYLTVHSRRSGLTIQQAQRTWRGFVQVGVRRREGGTVATIGEVRVRRVYDEPDGNDGVRVLVDRIWPRGMTKARAALDEWCKDVAPSTELRKWYSHDPAKFEEFSRRYVIELEQADRGQALQRLRNLATDRRLTLLTASKAVDISEAAVLAAILNR